MIGIIVQARLGSSRLPSKVLKKIGYKKVIDHVFDRLEKCKNADIVVLATTDNKKDEELVKWANKNQKNIYRGSENDVLSRYYNAAIKFNCDTIVRITSDCPFIDYEIVDNLIDVFKASNFDYVSNVHPPTYPDGLDVEIFSFESLSLANNSAKRNYEREHVTPYIWDKDNNFRQLNIKNKNDYSSLRFTLDTKQDLNFLREVYKTLANEYFVLKDLISFVKNNEDKLLLNHHHKRNENF